MAPLAAALCLIIGALAAEHAEQGRPPWHTWLASAGILAGTTTVIVLFVFVGRRLPD